METEEKPVELKKNNLNTKCLPPIFMLFGGLVSFVICFFRHIAIDKLLLIVFLSLLIFAIIGTVIKTVVDQFDMDRDYDDLFEDDDEGEVVEKADYK